MSSPSPGMLTRRQSGDRGGEKPVEPAGRDLTQKMRGRGPNRDSGGRFSSAAAQQAKMSASGAHAIEDAEAAARREALQAKARAAAGYFLPALASTTSTTTAPAAREQGGGGGGGEGEPEKTKYPVLASFGVPLGMDRAGKDCRGAILSELIAYNNRNDLKHELNKNNGTTTHLVEVPFRRRKGKKTAPIPTSNTSTIREKGGDGGGDGDGDGDDNNEGNGNGSGTMVPNANDDGRGDYFIKSCRRTGFVDDLLSALAETAHCDGTEESATDILLYYFAKRNPRSFAKYVDLANEEIAKEDKKKKKKKEPIVPPPGYQNFDGTDNVEWNVRYMEMVQYKEEHGNCLVPTRLDTELSRWMQRQRANHKSKSDFLTPKRFELLDDIGFVWAVRRDGDQFGRKGDPRFNRALAAKMAHPELTVRETLILGGYDEDGLDEVVDAKHTWRTRFVTLKDRMNKRVKGFDSSNETRTPAMDEVYRLLAMLKTPGGVGAVFGDKAGLLLKFLEDARLNPDREKAGRVRSRQQRERPSAESNDEEDAQDGAEEEQHIWRKKTRTE